MDVDVATSKGFEKMLALSGSMVEARERAFHEEEKNIGVVEKADMLTSFMKNGIAGAELKTEVILQIVAGSDTTAAAIRGTSKRRFLRFLVVYLSRSFVSWLLGGKRKRNS